MSGELRNTSQWAGRHPQQCIIGPAVLKAPRWRSLALLLSCLVRSIDHGEKDYQWTHCYLLGSRDKAAKDAPVFARLPEKTSNPRTGGSQRPLTPSSSFYKSAVGGLGRDTCSHAAALGYAAAPAGEPRQAFLASPAHDCPLWHGCS